MKIFLNSYYPISHTEYGRQAALKHKIHPLEDGSIRREPDFNQQFPSITGLCRPGSMTDIGLEMGDLMVYKTNGTHYLAAILKVKQRFDSHQSAAAWFNGNGYNSLPSNIIDRKALPLDMSHAMKYLDKVGKSSRLDSAIHSSWDSDYLARGNNTRSSYVFVTDPIYNAVRSNIHQSDFVVMEKLLRQHFRAIPNTSIRPQKLTEEFYAELLSLLTA